MSSTSSNVFQLAERRRQLEALESALRFAEQQRSSALIVTKDGRVLAERYWRDGGAETATTLTSASNSFVSILVGACIKHGAIRDVNQSAADFITEWRGTAHALIRIRHLLTMTSGLRTPALWHLALPGSSTLGIRLELLYPPGTTWEYNTFACRLLFTVIARATGQSLRDFTQQHLFDPLEMRCSRWKSRRVDGAEECLDILSTAPDMVKFGQLVLQRGLWNSRPLVSTDYMDETVRPERLNHSYGYLFWLNRGRRRFFAEAPVDTVAALGARYSCIYIIPSHGLVISRLGEWAGLPGERIGNRHDNPNTFHNILLKTVCAAVSGMQPASG